MTAYDVRARDKAAAKLAPISRGGKGVEITFAADIRGPYDTTAGEATSSPPVEQTGSGLILGRSDKDIPGTLVKTGDLKVMLSPLNSAGAALTKPKPGTKATVGTEAGWRVRDILPFQPAGLTIYFDAFFHKAK